MRPVPDAKSQERVEDLVRDVFGQELANAKIPSQYLDLAKRMLELAEDCKDDPTAYFVVLRMTRDVATQTREAVLVSDVVNRMAKTFQVDGISMKADCLDAIADVVNITSQYESLTKEACALVDVASAEERYEIAARMCEVARQSAFKTRNYKLAQSLADRAKRLEKLANAYAEYQKALARLETIPTDPDANFTAGRHLCLVAGDWDKGIPMLALGSDPDLKDLATKELTGANTPIEQVALADGWWSLAQSREGAEKIAFSQHAAVWYKRALLKLESGFSKLKVEKRLDAITRIEEHGSSFSSSKFEESTGEVI
ncbi:MAG: hypothetical protein ACYTG0_16895 [Planctomycetota bacterium]